MVTFDAKQFQEEIDAFVASVKQRVEQGVEAFAVYTATLLIRDTPYGDVDKYYSLYEKRQREFGFEMLPGLAKGSWVVSMNSAPNLGALEYDLPNGVKSGQRAMMTAQEYQIGDTIYISNSVPYINKLEAGSSKQLEAGGFQAAFEGVYSVNLNKFFKVKKQRVGNFE